MVPPCVMHVCNVANDCIQEDGRFEEIDGNRKLLVKAVIFVHTYKPMCYIMPHSLFCNNLNDFLVLMEIKYGNSRRARVLLAS